MKKKHINFKKLSFIITGLISVFLVIFALTYSLSTKFIQNNNEQTSLNQKPQNEIKTQAGVSTSNSLNDINTGASIKDGTSLANTPIILSDGSYIVTTTTGIDKISAFGTILYSYSFVDLLPNKYTKSFANYKTRQLVQNYSDPSLYYLLIYSPDVTIDLTGTDAASQNPGYILTLKDSGSDFLLVSSWTLLLPTSKLLSKVVFSPTLVGPKTTDDDITSVSTGTTTLGLNDKWTMPADADKKAPGINYDKSVIDNLYLNNLNNMVFIENTIFIFGGNYLPSFWFWGMDLSATNSTTENLFWKPAEAKLYLTVGATDWPSTVIYSSPQIVDPADPTNFLGIKDGGPIVRYDKTGAYYYPAYFIAGVKTIAQNNYVNGKVVNTTYTVQALYSIAGYIDVAKSKTDIESAFLNVSYLDAKGVILKTSYWPAYSVKARAYYFLLSMNGTDAKSMTSYLNGSDPTNQRLFKKNTFGYTDNILNFSALSDPDGYINSLTSKIYGFDIQAIPPMSGNGLDSVNGLMFSRDEFGRIIYDPLTLIPVTHYKSGVTPGNFVKEYSVRLTSKNQINQSYAKQIYFAKNAWYILINDGINSSVLGINLSGSYVPIKSNTDVLSPSQITLNFESINVLDGSQIIGLLPVSDNFTYALVKDNKTSNVTVSLFKRNLFVGSYEIDNAYVYSPSLPNYANNTSIWGKITLKDSTYLNNAGYFSNTASEIANDPKKLQDIITYIPAWPGQVATVTVPNIITDQTKLPVTINVEYFNNKMYNNQSFSQSLGFPDPTLTGLSALPSWVIPVSVGVSVGIAALILILGLSIGIPMTKNRKLQDKGFSHTFKKVDILTSAVGSVYKKIITETSAIKKKPQMLKSTAPKPTAKPASAPKLPSSTSVLGPKPVQPPKSPINKPKPITAS